MHKRIALLVVGAFTALSAGRAMVGCTGSDPTTAPITTPNACDGGDCNASSSSGGGGSVGACTTDTDCTSLCMKCDVIGKTCVFVGRGEAPPTGSCPAKTGLDAVCTPGGCDGNAAKCLNGALDTPCRTATCDPVSRTEIVTAFCAADGSCDIPPAVSCGGNTCNGIACARACTLDGDCTTTHYCDGTNCQQKKDNGAACMDNKECTSASCADGVCCDKACTGACEKCNGAVAGTCEIVTSPTAVHGTCTNQGQDPCGGRCDGINAECTYPTAQCKAAACRCAPPFGGVQPGCFSKPAVNCAAGSCPAQVETLCPGNFTCNGTACHTPPCDGPGPGTEECYEGSTCKQAPNPANNYCELNGP